VRAREHAVGGSRRAAVRRAGAALGPLAALALFAAPARSQPVEGRGGYWRDADGTGYYHVQILGRDDGASVKIDWIASDPDAGASAVVASVTLADLGGGRPWQLVNPELRPEGDVTLLLLSAHDPWTDARRTLAVELGAPGRYRLRE